MPFENCFNGSEGEMTVISLGELVIFKGKSVIISSGLFVLYLLPS